MIGLFCSWSSCPSINWQCQRRPASWHGSTSRSTGLRCSPSLCGQPSLCTWCTEGYGWLANVLYLEQENCRIFKVYGSCCKTGECSVCGYAIARTVHSRGSPEICLTSCRGGSESSVMCDLYVEFWCLLPDVSAVSQVVPILQACSCCFGCLSKQVRCGQMGNIARLQRGIGQGSFASALPYAFAIVMNSRRDGIEATRAGYWSPGTTF